MNSIHSYKLLKKDVLDAFLYKELRLYKANDDLHTTIAEIIQQFLGEVEETRCIILDFKDINTWNSAVSDGKLNNANVIIIQNYSLLSNCDQETINKVLNMLRGMHETSKYQNKPLHIFMITNFEKLPIQTTGSCFGTTNHKTITFE